MIETDTDHTVLKSTPFVPSLERLDKKKGVYNPQLKCKLCDYFCNLEHTPRTHSSFVPQNRTTDGWGAMRYHWRRYHSSEYAKISQWINDTTGYKLKRVVEHEELMGGHLLNAYVNLPTYNDLVSEPDDYREDSGYESSESLTEHGYNRAENMTGYRFK